MADLDFAPLQEAMDRAQISAIEYALLTDLLKAELPPCAERVYSIAYVRGFAACAAGLSPQMAKSIREACNAIAKKITDGTFLPKDPRV